VVRDGWVKEKFSIYVSAYAKETNDSICGFDVTYKSFKKKGLIFDFKFGDGSGTIELKVTGDAVMKLRPGAAHAIESAQGGAVYKVEWIRIKEKDQGPYNGDLEKGVEKFVEKVVVD